MRILVYPHIVASKSATPSAGLVFPVPDFCQFEADKSKCKEHYTLIKGRPGYHNCPYGFTSYISPLNPDVILTALRIKGRSDLSRTTRRERGDFSPVIPSSDFEESLSKVAVQESAMDTRVQMRGETQARRHAVSADNDRHRTLAKFTLHEVRALNTQIMSSVETLRGLTPEPGATDVQQQRISRLLTTIWAASSMTSVRLNVYDIEENPAILTTGASHRTAIYRKFEKAAHCLRQISKNQKVRIELKGSSFGKISAHAVFDLLPFVLLENALKYSPPDQEIEVLFDECQTSLSVVIRSMGPLLLAEESALVFIKGFRGENARRKNLSSESYGYGLYLARIICDTHGIGLEVKSESNLIFEIEGVEHAPFTATLSFSLVGTIF